MWFGDHSLYMLSRGLDVASLRQKVHAHNVANLNTPGFSSKFVSFEENLRGALDQGDSGIKATHPRHLQSQESFAPQVKRKEGTFRRPDGNNVDLDREMLTIVNNQLRYNTMIQLLNSRIASWRFVINEGRR